MCFLYQMESYQHTGASAQPSSVFEQDPNPLVHATTGQRFANLLIDLAVAYAAIFLLSFLLAMVFPSYAMLAYEASESDDLSAKLIFNLFALVFLTAVYTLIEGTTKGKTLGKLITGTRAVREDDGSRIGWKEAFIRSISRWVPFEVFSGLSGHPWHDKWSKTIVVREDSLRPVH